MMRRGMTGRLAIVGRGLCALASFGLLFGCTYIQQREDLMQGGPARREADANTALQAAKTQGQDLQDQNTQLQREIDRNARRVEAAQSELDRVSAELEAARKRKAVSEAEYKRLKSQLAAANSELSSVNMQLDAGRLGAKVDVAAKEKEIGALEKKKAELEKALSMTPGS